MRNVSKALRASLAILAVSLAASGCGSSHSASPGARHYSVSEVLHAFASQGIDLTRWRRRTARLHSLRLPHSTEGKRIVRHVRNVLKDTRMVGLQAGRPPDAVRAVLMVHVAFIAGIRTSVLAARRRRGVLTRWRGNLLVWFDRSQRAAVDAALNDLH
jgi:hypothetical protein